MVESRLKTRPDSVLEDPGVLAVASLYARSYLTAAQQAGVSEAVEELISFVDEVVEKHPEILDTLTSTFVSRDDKLAIIDRTVVGRVSDCLSNFLRVLVRHSRIDLLPVIRQVVTRILEEAAGQKRVRVRSAKALTDVSRKQVVEQLKEKLGFEPILQESVDESLIGGLIIQVGDTVYDSSLRSRLQQLRGRLVEKALNEIQSGRDRFSHTEGN
ncbi:MAG: ATP synthase F1 subunit delta [Planctomycetaceae bacterium]